MDSGRLMDARTKYEASIFSALNGVTPFFLVTSFQIMFPFIELISDMYWPIIPDDTISAQCTALCED
jgi:hypothetical protein